MAYQATNRLLTESRLQAGSPSLKMRADPDLEHEPRRPGVLSRPMEYQGPTPRVTVTLPSGERKAVVELTESECRERIAALDKRVRHKRLLEE